MKILYISTGTSEDYQRDTLFHGLRELFGADAVDAARINSLYETTDDLKHAMYGRGYTVYGNLPDIPVDRGSIASRIESQEFDLVIYGSIHRCNDHLRRVRKHYPPSRIVFVDGEDLPRVKWSLLGKGIYFKRELLQPLQPFLQPIHFAVPRSKFVTDSVFESNLAIKRTVFSHCDPRDRSTYIFKTEPSYYEQYETAFYGVTMKKAGWDAMRHHEIVARGTAPYFMGLEDCPEWTLHPLPRQLLFELRALADASPDSFSTAAQTTYAGLLQKLFDSYKRLFSTVALAEYVLRVAANSTDLDTHRSSAFLLQAKRALRASRRQYQAARA